VELVPNFVDIWSNLTGLESKYSFIKSADLIKLRKFQFYNN